MSSFKNGLYSLCSLQVAAVLSALSVPNAFSTEVFYDNFDSYANDASLTSVWTRSLGTSANIFLAPDPINPANQTVEQNLTAGRLRHLISGGVVPTAAEPVISFSFDFYDVGGSGRQFAEFRNSTGLTGLMAAGIYNSVNVGTYDATKYSARNLDGGGWISLDTSRSVGWHNFRFEITPGHAELYVDDVLEPKFGAMSFTGTSYDYLYIGSGLSSAAAVGFYDNVKVQILAVPEPSVAMLGLLGLGGMFGLTWLRQRSLTRRLNK